jgi:hypothetical protein
MIGDPIHKRQSINCQGRNRSCSPKDFTLTEKRCFRSRNGYMQPKATNDSTCELFGALRLGEQSVRFKIDPFFP